MGCGLAGGIVNGTPKAPLSQAQVYFNTRRLLCGVKIHIYPEEMRSGIFEASEWVPLVLV